MALPDGRFDVVRKENLGTRPIPRNRTSGREEITQNDIVCLLLQQFSQSFANDRAGNISPSYKVLARKDGRGNPSTPQPPWLWAGSGE